ASRCHYLLGTRPFAVALPCSFQEAEQLDPRDVFYPGRLRRSNGGLVHSAVRLACKMRRALAIFRSAVVGAFASGTAQVKHMPDDRWIGIGHGSRQAMDSVTPP